MAEEVGLQWWSRLAKEIQTSIQSSMQHVEKVCAPAAFGEDSGGI